MLAREFTNGVRQRGREYFQSGTVHGLRRVDDTILADVQGSETYDVTLTVKDGVIADGRCTCRFFLDRAPCKHMWAVLLAAEKRWPEFTTDVPPRSRPEPQPVAAGVGEEEHHHQQSAHAGGPREHRRDRDRGDRHDRRDRRDRGDRGDRDHGNRRQQGGQNGRHQQHQDQKQQLPELGWERTFDRITQRLRPPAPPRDEAPRQDLGEMIFVIDPNPERHRDGRLHVRVGSRFVTKPGEAPRIKVYRPENLRPGDWPGEPDRLLLAQILGAGHDAGNRNEGPALSPVMRNSLLPQLAATNRVFLWHESSGQPFPTKPLTWDDGPAWQFGAVAERDANNDIVLRGELRRGDERMPLSHPRLMFLGGLMVTPDAFARFEESGAAGWISYLRGNRTLVIPGAQSDKFLSKLMHLERIPQIDLPDDLHVTVFTSSPQPRAVFRDAVPNDPHGDYARVEPQYNYDGTIVDPSERSARVYDVQNRRLITRQPVAEASAIARLRKMDMREVRDYYTGKRRFTCPPNRVIESVETLVSEGWDVEVYGKPARTSGKFDLDVSSSKGTDWFDVNGSVTFAGQTARLPALLDAVRRGESTVTLDDGSIGVLSADVRRQLAWLNAGKAQGDSVRFSGGQIGVLDALLESMPEARCDAAFQKLRDQLHAFEGIEEVDPPKSFKGKLRPYQKMALGWFGFLRRFSFGGILADDMGLGKTVEVLSLLESRRVEKEKDKKNSSPRPSLVVVPRSLVFNWTNEAAKFAPKMKVLDFSHADRGDAVEHLAEYDLVLSTYGTLRTDAAKLKGVRFDYVILDEAHAIKNPASQSAKAAKLLVGDYRLAMTGTPVQNHLGDLWSQMEFLNPGMLGTADVFSAAGGKDAGDEARATLARAVKPFILRRTKEQVAPELPKRNEQTLVCTLEGKEREQYDELREHYRKVLLKKVDDVGLGKSKIQVLEALLRLRQAAIHPGLVDKKRIGEPSAKLDMLLGRIDEVVEDHKAIVFSQFTTMLSIVRDRLDAAGVKYEYLDGATTDRQTPVERFQNDPSVRVFLISLKAGGVGLNLTAAEYVFLLDPWWNPAIEAQAIDRTHRIGQTKNIYACRLIAKDTVEEKVLDLQESKKKLADAIVTGDESMLKSLKREDLELLLS